MVQHAGDNATEFRTQYGNISTASIGAIQRSLLALETQGGANLFGEPALEIEDLLQTSGSRGVVNILAADKLLSGPRLYSTLLLWLLSELFEKLPEVGDPEKPKLVFFFDEAHLLFSEAPKELLERIEQVVRLIARRASACTSSPRTRSTCPTRCSASSATACSTRCAPTRRATRRP
jgi:DNA helicase HerA-like ATPase